MKKKIGIAIAIVALLLLVIVIAVMPRNAKTPLVTPAEEPASPAETEVQTPGSQTPDADGTDTKTQAPGEEEIKPEDEPEDEPAGGIVGEDEGEGTVVNVTPDTNWTDWDTFLAMTPEEQDEFMLSFESLEAFTEWMTTAQKEWAVAHPAEEIGPGDVIHIGG